MSLQPIARLTDPGTSHAAAASIDRSRLLQTQRFIIMLLEHEGPMTDNMIESAWHEHVRQPISPSGLRTRRRELTDLGLIRDSGRTIRLASGRSSIVWELA